MRYLCSDLVALYWTEGSRRRNGTVVLENISAGGACLQTDFTLADQTRVRLRCGKQNFTGVVRYCQLHVGGCFLGIQFDADSRWSKAKYSPEHLLDPRKVPAHRTPKPAVM
jgi:hypothetical protein